MKRMLPVIVCLASCLLAPIVHAADNKAMPDPSGTWRWNFDINGNTIDNVLKVNADKDGKLTGILEARGLKMDVREGKVTGDEVSFQIEAQLDQKITVLFLGKIAGDRISGNFTAKVDGEAREFEWTATRSVQAADVVGAWQLHIVTPDGETLQPVLTIAEKDKVLNATYALNGKTIDVSKFRLKDNQLTFEVDSEYQGSPLHVNYKVRPLGAKMKGSLEYSVDGDSGQLDFTGMRKEK
ncbi:MAG: hypothetical protein R3C17_21510 [Planctomycetaceae bacterium]